MWGVIINEQSHPALKSFISFLLTGNEIGRSSPTVSIMIFIHLMVHWIGINHVANEIGFELGILYMLRFQTNASSKCLCSGVELWICIVTQHSGSVDDLLWWKLMWRRNAAFVDAPTCIDSVYVNASIMVL